MPNTVWHVRHHDHPTPTDYYLPSQRTTKVFVALWDIPENGGCTALVPKTHRLPGELTYSLFLSVPLPCVGAQDSPVACFMLEFFRTQAVSCRAHKLDRSCSLVGSAHTPSATTMRVRRTAHELYHRRLCQITSRWQYQLAADSCSTAASGIPVSSRRCRSLLIHFLCSQHPLADSDAQISLFSR
jgi:hypothetical protein